MTRFAQLSLDGFSGPSAKIIALNKVERNADPHWTHAARRNLEEVAAEHDEFTTDAVWDLLDSEGFAPPREPRAMGAVMRKAAQDNIIAATGRYEQSSREVNHQRPVMIWRSLVR